jgi:flavin-dependent dehydrogenase
MKGYDVVVFERDLFPREHVGESLLPFCYRILEELGVLDQMVDHFVRKPGVRFLDIDDTTATTWCFAHTIKDDSYLSFEVLRSEFDEMLLDHSAALGAEVHEETKVHDIDLDGTDVRVRATGPNGDEYDVSCRFVVDASGRDTFLSNRMKTKRAHKMLDRTALSSSHWSGAKYEGGLQEGMIQIVYTGGEKQGWIWVIPLSTDRLSIGVVMNSAYFREQRALLKEQGVEDWQQALYTQELDKSSFCKRILADAKQERPVLYNGDYSYSCEQKWGDKFCLVGDASAFIDPIFSSGVYLSMNSARLAAGAIDTMLSKGIEDGREALGDTYENITAAYTLVDKLIRLFYTPEILNFAQLGSASQAFEDYDHYANAMALQHFLLAGDFFEQANRYSEFIDELRDPKLFRRYQSYTFNRPAFRADSTCDLSHEEIFPANGAAHDERRAYLGI